MQIKNLYIIVTSIIIFTLSCSPYGLDPARQNTETARMNILQICVKGWSTSMVGCYASSMLISTNTIANTPHLDALAKQGVTFTRAYCQTPISNPSRVSFFTGTRPDSNHIYSDHDIIHQHLSANIPFVAKTLKQKPNVFTAQFGTLTIPTPFVDKFDQIMNDPIQTLHALAKKKTQFFLSITYQEASPSVIDTEIGKLMKTLKDTDLYKKTIVIFVSDHGTRPKHILDDNATRVPLIISIPGSTQHGQICEGLVELVDIVPTLCDLWQVEAPDTLDGISLIPWLEYPQRPGKEAAFSQLTGPTNARCLYTRQYRYCEIFTQNSSSQPTRELYNLVRDPHEQINLVSDPGHAKTVRNLTALLHKGWQAVHPGSQHQ